MDKEIALSSAMSVLERGSNFSIDNSEDFNRCFDHVMGLLKDAALLFKSGSYATSTFMSIAAIEESSKSELSLYTRRESENKHRNDPLRDHKKKETAAVMHTVAMGGRLVDALGDERIEELVDLLRRAKTPS